MKTVLCIGSMVFQPNFRVARGVDIIVVHSQRPLNTQAGMIVSPKQERSAWVEWIAQKGPVQASASTIWGPRLNSAVLS